MKVSDYHANMILVIDSNDTSDGGQREALVDLHLTRNDLDKWMRLNIPVESFWTYTTLNYNRTDKTAADFANYKISHITFMGETKTRKVAQNYNGINVDSFPKLFKEMPIEIKFLEFSTAGNGFSEN